MLENYANVMNVGPYGESLSVGKIDEWGFELLWELPDGQTHSIKISRGHAQQLSQVLTDMLADPKKALEIHSLANS